MPVEPFFPFLFLRRRALAPASLFDDRHFPKLPLMFPYALLHMPYSFHYLQLPFYINVICYYFPAGPPDVPVPAAVGSRPGCLLPLRPRWRCSPAAAAGDALAASSSSWAAPAPPRPAGGGFTHPAPPTPTPCAPPHSLPTSAPTAGAAPTATSSDSLARAGVGRGVRRRPPQWPSGDGEVRDTLFSVHL